MTPPQQAQHFDAEEQKILNGMIEHWRTVSNEAPVQAIVRVEEAAKQMIVVTTGLQGLYLAIFALSTIREQVMTTLGGILGGLIMLLLCTPMACWLMSLLYATRVFVPRILPEVDSNEISASAWQQVKNAYRDGMEKKLRWLHRSHGWLIASFVIVLLSIGCLLFLPTPQINPTQIIIVTPTPTVKPPPP